MKKKVTEFGKCAAYLMSRAKTGSLGSALSLRLEDPALEGASASMEEEVPGRTALARRRPRRRSRREEDEEERVGVLLMVRVFKSIRLRQVFLFNRTNALLELSLSVKT